MSDWTPPASVWVIYRAPNAIPIDVMDEGCLGDDGEVREEYRLSGEVGVEYVPVSVVDALREENARLTRERDEAWLGASNIATDLAYTEVVTLREAEDEADALRARVEELEAGVSTHRAHVLHGGGPTCMEADEALWALLSGESQEPDPDTDDPLVEKAIEFVPGLIAPGRPDTDETCPACFGTGNYARNGDCASCGGSGRRPDTKETT